MKGFLVGFPLLAALLNNVFAEPAKIMYQQGKFNQAGQTLEPTDPTNEFYLGKLRLYGYGLLKNTPLALQYFTSAAKKGYLPAEQLLARYSLVAENDPTKALGWFKKAADQGDTNARLYCAAAYLFGYGTSKNPDMARRFYIEAAKDGDPLAQFTLANHFLEDKHQNSKTLGLIWLMKAVNKGNAQAQDAYAELLIQGKLLPQDLPQAQNLLEQAAQKGLKQAMIHLGELAQSQQKYELAKSWYMKANTPPNSAAMLALANLYTTPNTPFYQPKEAFLLTLQAAQQPHPTSEAALALSQLYAQGTGTAIDATLAEQWKQKAASLTKWEAKQPTPQSTIIQWLTEGKTMDLTQTPYRLEGILTAWTNAQTRADHRYNQPPLMPTLSSTQLFKPHFSPLQPNEIPLAEYFDTVVAYTPNRSPTFQDYPQYPLFSSIAFFKNQASPVLKHPELTQMIFPEAEFVEVTDEPTVMTLLNLVPDNQIKRINYQHALLDLYNRAILSDAAAQFELGQLYQTGVGVAKNLNQAITYYELAATQQEIRAEYNLGLLYLSGESGTQNLAKGLDWLTDAAFKGNAYAEYVLGSIYQRGLTDATGQLLLEPNPEQSLAMYYLAASNKFGPAEYQLANQLVKQNQATLTIQAKEQRQHFIKQLYQEAAEQGVADARLPLAYYLAMSTKEVEKQKAFKIAQEQAEGGSRTAALLLGMLYDRGIGVAPNHHEALNWYEAALNHPVAAFILGTYASLGVEAPKDKEKARAFLSYASEQRLPYATYNLAIYHYKNQEPFLPTLEKSQQEGSPTAGLLLADYTISQSQTPENLRLAKDIYTTFAEKGDRNAATKLGYLYDKGIGVDTNPALAEKWYQVAAIQHQPTAQFLLGQLYQSGQLDSPNYPEAEKWYEASAKQGNLDAQVALGFVKETAQDDYHQAAIDYRIAADKNDAIAQYNLGLIKEYGKGQPVDYTAAFNLYLSAAKHHLPQAMTQLAQLYLKGLGTPKEPETGKYWLEEAAKTGDANALYELGMLLLPTQPDQAFQSIEKAAQLRHEPALQEMARLKSMIQPRGSRIPALQLPTISQTLNKESIVDKL